MTRRELAKLSYKHTNQLSYKSIFYSIKELFYYPESYYPIGTVFCQPVLGVQMIRSKIPLTDAEVGAGAGGGRRDEELRKVI